MEMAKSDVTSNPRKRKRKLQQKLNQKLQKQQRKLDESNKEPPVDNSMQKDKSNKEPPVDNSMQKDESNKEPPVDNSMQKDEQRELDESNKGPPVDNSMQKDVESAQNNAESGGQQIKTKKKKKKKKKKKVCNTSNDSNILNYPEDDGSLVAENPPLETDSSLQPPLNIYLKTDAKMVEHNVEVTLDVETNKLKENTDVQSNACMSLAKEKNKGEECNKKHNALDNNNTNHDVEEQTWTSDVPILEPSVTNCLMKGAESAQNNTKRTRKRRKKNKGHIASENSNIHNNLEEKSLLVENPPLERDSEMVEFNAEMTLYEQKTKGKEKFESYNTQSNAGTSCPKENNTNKECNERHNASVNNDIDHDDQEGGVVPNPESVCGKHIGKADSSSVSSHVEMDLTRIKENYEPPIVNNRPSTCSDTCSIMKGDSCSGVHQKMKQEQIKTYRRKRLKLSDSLGPSLEPIQEDETSSLMQVPQSSWTKESSIDCFGEAGMMQITESISVEKASVNCVDCQPASEESKRIVKVNNSKRTSNEDSFAEDMPVLSIPTCQSEQPNMGKHEKIQIEDGVYVGKNLNESTTCSNEKSFDDPLGCDPSCKLLKQNNVEVTEPSSSDLNAMEDNADLLIKNEDNPPEKAITGHSRKKLLILDLNGLLADIVPYVSDGTKPDTIISGKAVFKRPFCDDFLQFCFERFDVGVWSSRTKKNVDKVIDFLMGKSIRKLLFCWDQSHCTYTGFKTIENSEKPLVLKELKKIWEKGEYNESNTLLLDDSPYKALRNPAHTAIFPRTYRYKDIRDCSLGPGGDLRVYLEGLAASENVQEYVKQNPFGQRAITESNCSWGFYRKIVSADSSRRR